jgi:predicted AAA+ superfamily ATPase
MISRARLTEKIKVGIQESPVTVLLGARQVGKTTLARTIAEEHQALSYFDLERAADRAALSTPELTLGGCRGLVVLDEIQRIPDLFTTLRPLCDRPDTPARFLLLGSASPDLVSGVSESLAGRALFVQVPGFALEEVGPDTQDRLWLRGGFPRAFLAKSEDASWRWMEGFVTTFVERDLPQLGLRVPSAAVRRFWAMMAHYHGQIWNASELARSMGVTPNTARHYLDILHGAFIARVLPPWHENMKKRQVKSPKVYLRDSGLLHFLLGIETLAALRSNPRYGASWEGFALEQVLIHFGDRDAWFWSTTRGAELDLLLVRRGRRFGFEFKCTDAPAMTRSLHVAVADLGLEKAFVVYPGDGRYPIHESVEALPLRELPRLNLWEKEG